MTAYISNDPGADYTTPAYSARVVYKDFDGNPVDQGMWEKFIEVRGLLYPVDSIIAGARGYRPEQLEFNKGYYVRQELSSITSGSLHAESPTEGASGADAPHEGREAAESEAHGRGSA